MSNEKKSESKMWLVADHPNQNDGEVYQYPRLSDPVKVLLETYEPGDTLPTTQKTPVGIVYEHEDGIGESLHAIPLLDYSAVNSILGKVLTFVDATYADKEQREATKKILRTTIWEYNNYLQESLKRSVKQAEETKAIN